MRNEDGFKTRLVGMGEVFGKEVTPSLGQIYWTTLKEFTDEQVDSAFDRALATLKFFPKPAELREFITGTGDEQAHEAWSEVLHCLERGKPPPEYVHEITRQLGGWGNLKQKTYRELDFVKRDFVELYSLKASRGAIDAPALEQNSPLRLVDDSRNGSAA